MHRSILIVKLLNCLHYGVRLPRDPREQGISSIQITSMSMSQKGPGPNEFQFGQDIHITSSYLDI